MSTLQEDNNNLGEWQELRVQPDPPDFINMTIGQMMSHAQRESNKMMKDVRGFANTMIAGMIGLFTMNILVILAVIFL